MNICFLLDYLVCSSFENHFNINILLYSVCFYNDFFRRSKLIPQTLCWLHCSQTLSWTGLWTLLMSRVNPQSWIIRKLWNTSFEENVDDSSRRETIRSPETHFAIFFFPSQWSSFCSSTFASISGEDVRSVWQVSWILLALLLCNKTEKMFEVHWWDISLSGEKKKKRNTQQAQVSSWIRMKPLPMVTCNIFCNAIRINVFRDLNLGLQAFSLLANRLIIALIKVCCWSSETESGYQVYSWKRERKKRKH